MMNTFWLHVTCGVKRSSVHRSSPIFPVVLHYTIVSLSHELNLQDRIATLISVHGFLRGINVSWIHT